MTNNSRINRGFGLSAILAVGAVAVGCSGAFLSRSVKAAEPTPNSPTTVVSSPSSVDVQKRTGVLAEIENGFSAIAESVEPSVVSIRTKRTVSSRGAGSPFQMSPFGDDDFPGLRRFRGGGGAPQQFKMEGGGSGVIVRADGWILTNDHVVDGADKVTVKLHDGRELEGTVRRDYRSDIALVKIDASGLPAAEFSDSDKVKVGQWAIAFGSPFNLDDTMTVGIISAQSRQKTISEDGMTGRFYPSLLQTDASVNPGNSGGPLVDSRGRVMGINVAINSPSGGSVGIGFAIPARIAKNVMDQLISKGKVTRGFLGVVPMNLNPDDRKRYGVNEGGALVREVSQNTPAARAGLMVEDVVVKIDGRAIQSDFDMRETIASKSPGSKVDIVVRRGGKEQTLTATIEAAPEVPGEGSAKPADAQPESKLGLKVETFTPALAERYGIKGVQNGAVVTEVEGGGPASEAGLAPGQVIVRANGQAVGSALDFSKVTKSATGRITLDVLQGNTRRLVVVEVK